MKVYSSLCYHGISILGTGFLNIEIRFVLFTIGYTLFSALLGILLYEKFRSGRREFFTLCLLFGSLALFNVLYFLQNMKERTYIEMMLLDAIGITLLYLVLHSLIMLAANIDFFSEKISRFSPFFLILPVLGFVYWFVSDSLLLYGISIAAIMIFLMSFSIYLALTLFRIKDKNPYERLLFRFLVIAFIIAFLIAVALFSRILTQRALVSEMFINTLIYLQGIISIPIFFYMREIHSQKRNSKGTLEESKLRRFNISPRESQVITLLLEGHTYREIADQLCISHDTVKSHLYSSYRKAGVRSRQELREKIQ